jgi:hypothetical protein
MNGALLISARFGDISALRKLLANESALITCLDANGKALLHWSVINDLPSIAELLLESGSGIKRARYSSFSLISKFRR